MADLTRRSFLGTTGVAAATVTGGTAGLGALLTARPAGATAVAGVSAPETFGPAALSAAIVGMAVDGNTAYLVTRGQTPPKVVTVDLAGRSVEKIVRLPRGDGGWAATVSGGKVYIGTYPFPDLYCYDPATDEIEFLGTIGPSGGFVWCLTTAPDGTVYAGTSPRCELWEYRPDTGVLRKVGRVASDVRYARVVAADDRNVYVGTTPLRHIMAVDRVTGEMKDIFPPELDRAGAVYSIVATGDRVIAGIGGAIIDLAPDGSDAIVIPAPDDPPLIDALTFTSDGQLFAAGRRSGSVYRRAGNSLEIMATVNAGDETRALTVQGGSTLVGCGGSGVLWYHDLDSHETSLLELSDTEVAGPDLVQSIAFDGARSVYVGGHFSITTHRPADGFAGRIRVAGEAKAMLPMDGKVLAALYPSGEVIEVDPVTGDVGSFGLLGHEQQRPWEMIHDAQRNLVLIASAPRSGLLEGALTVLDLATRRLSTYRGVLPDQSVMSVALDDGIAYLAGDTWGSGGTRVRSTAQVAAFDLESRSVLWRAEPLAECASMQHVEVHDGIIYGVYKRISGRWFAMDLSTRTVLQQGQVSGYGEIVTHRDQVFAATNFADNIYRLRPDREAELLAGPIATSWFTVPQLEFDPRSWRAWGVAGRELARFDLHPRHRRA